MPKAHGPKEKKLLSKSYAICTNQVGQGEKREECVKKLFKRLKSEG
jgi:hypothetical protein